METYENEEITFKGELIGDTSTAAPDKKRWVDIYIFRTEGGNFVSEVYGMSDVPGEEDRLTVHVADTPAELVSLLRHKNRLSKPAREAIEAASKRDARFEEAKLQHIP